jgi:ABC-type dipeptide/oligopeptide/nickel transport system permease subunit
MADLTQELAIPTLESRATRSLYWDAVRHMLTRIPVALSVAFLLLVVFLAVFAPLVTSVSYSDIAFDPLQPPDWAHIAGTDQLGRDVWTRLVYGARTSLLVGFGSQLIALPLGLALGAIAGFYGGVVDSVMMRGTEIVLALPPVLVALLFVTVFGTGTAVITVAIGFSSWPILARVVRSVTIQTRELDFVDAAFSIGCSRFRVLRVHVLPHLVPAIIVQVTFGISTAIFTEAFLSFLGLGAQPPSPSWGQLLVNGFEFVRTSAYLVVVPALAITLTILALNVLGDGLRDAFDPRQGQ